LGKKSQSKIAKSTNQYIQLDEFFDCLIVKLLDWWEGNPQSTNQQINKSTNQQINKFFSWGEQDSNLRRHQPADLQSAPVGHFGISPSQTNRQNRSIRNLKKNKAIFLSRWRDSNPRPADYKSAALAN
jgi:hypothetical protein